jgi:hypothetical protein
MDIRHDSPKEPIGKEGSVEGMDDAPRLTEDDERAIEAIRCQLDRQYPASPRLDQQYPVSPRKGAAARHTRWDPAGDEEAEQKRRPRNRARLAWIVASTLLFACVVSGVAGALATLLYFRNADRPLVADPQRPPARSEALEPPSAAEGPVPSGPASQVDESLTASDAAGGVAGDLANLLDFKNADRLVIASPQGPRPGPETLGPPSTADAPILSGPASRVDESLTAGDVLPGKVEEPPATPRTPPRVVQAP